MPINLPSNLIISNVQIKHDTPVFYNESINRKGNSYDRGVHQLKGSFDVTIQTEEHQRAFESFLIKARGRLNPFYISLGKRFSTNINNLFLDGIHSIGQNQLGFGLGVGTIYDGTMFTLANDDKVYMTVQDYTHAQPIEIFPPLRKAQPDGAAATFRDIKVLARLESDIQMVDYEEAGLMHTSTLNWIEVL